MPHHTAGWDHHNHLTKVTFKNNSGTVTKAAEYAYDLFNRRIKKSVDVSTGTELAFVCRAG